MNKEFKNELTELINKHSIDNSCQTPDFILADIIAANLWSIASMMQVRENWFGRAKTGIETLCELKKDDEMRGGE